MSFRIRLLIAFLIYGVVLTSLTQLLVFQLSEKTIKEESVKRSADYARKLDKEFQTHISDSKYVLRTVLESELFHQYFTPNNIHSNLKELFLDLAKTSTVIMEFRYIDLDGNERIRIDRPTTKDTPYIVPDGNLQNKSQRYYFKEAIKLNRGEYYYSKLDLNIEKGELEKPIKPVFRVATPLFYDGKKVGVLVVNLFMKSFLEELTKTDLYKVYIVDKSGYIIVDYEHKKCWSKYFKNGRKKITDLEGNISNIINTDEYIGESVYAKKIDIPSSEDIYIVVFPDNGYLQKELDENLKELLWILLITVIISLILSYLMSIKPARLKKRVDILNYTLEKEAKEREVLLSLFDLSNSVLFKWNNDENWSVSFVSKSVEHLLGYSKDDFENNKISYTQCIYPNDLETVTKEVHEALEKNLYFFIHKPYRVVTKEGNIKWILDNTVIVRDENNDVVSFVGYLSDITDLKAKELELERLARTDQLTKINNRVYLDEVLHSQYYRFIRNNETCSVILLDIDHFKNVNDEFGHIVGDKVLVEFSSIIKKTLREGDTLGRWGGEEFLVILPHTTLQQAQKVAQKLCEEIRSHKFEIVNHITASCGVSTFIHKISVEQVVNLADKALYEAKSAGRDCVRVAK